LGWHIIGVIVSLIDIRTILIATIIRIMDLISIGISFSIIIIISIIIVIDLCDIIDIVIKNLLEFAEILLQITLQITVRH